MKIVRMLFKKAISKAAQAKRRIVLCAVRWASERRENAAGGLFQ